MVTITWSQNVGTWWWLENVGNEDDGSLNALIPILKTDYLKKRMGDCRNSIFGLFVLVQIFCESRFGTIAHKNKKQITALTQWSICFDNWRQKNSKRAVDLTKKVIGHSIQALSLFNNQPIKQVNLQ
jgi:hypothetical protein